MLSIIIPFYNEEENLGILTNQLIESLKKIQIDYEIILVDDGSTDNSKLKVSSLIKTSEDKAKIKTVFHKKKLGKGTALLTGFKESKGEIIVFMDADLQDDPSDLPNFIDKINQGYDLVNGWRKDRNDPLEKKIPSSIFNFLLLRSFLKSKFHDVNCGFKAMRRQVLNQISLYGDNYRFLPILADRAGFRTTEIVVHHKPRIHGKSKYGSLRIFFGLFDTLTTYFVIRFSERPLHFFGLIGGILFLIGSVILLILTLQRLFLNMMLYRRPGLFYGILLIIVGIQIVMTGIIAELIVYLHKMKK